MKLRNIAAIGLGASALLCAGVYKPSEKKPDSHESHELSDDRSKIEDAITSIFDHDSGEEVDPEEYTVDVQLDEDGNVAEGYRYLGAIRDCVKSTGKYKCFDHLFGGRSECFPSDIKDGQIPVVISEQSINYDYDNDNGDGQRRMGINRGGDYSVLSFDRTDPVSFQSGLDDACRDVVNKLEDNDAVSDEKLALSIEEQMSQYSEYLGASEEFFADLNEIGFEVKDIGGNIFEVDLGNGNAARLNVQFMYSGKDDESVSVGYQVHAEINSDDLGFSLSTRSNDADEVLEGLIHLEDLAQQ